MYLTRITIEVPTVMTLSDVCGVEVSGLQGRKHLLYPGDRLDMYCYPQDTITIREVKLDKE